MAQSGRRSAVGYSSDDLVEHDLSDDSVLDYAEVSTKPPKANWVQPFASSTLGASASGQLKLQEPTSTTTVAQQKSGQDPVASEPHDSLVKCTAGSPVTEELKTTLLKEENDIEHDYSKTEVLNDMQAASQDAKGNPEDEGCPAASKPLESPSAIVKPSHSDLENFNAAQSTQSDLAAHLTAPGDEISAARPGDRTNKRSPTATKTDDNIYEWLMRGIFYEAPTNKGFQQLREWKVCWSVYMFAVHGTAMVEIGWTADTVTKRAEKASKSCGAERSEIVSARFNRQDAKVVFNLLRATLKPSKHVPLQACKCGKTHKDTFEVPEVVAKEALELWGDWLTEETCFRGDDRHCDFLEWKLNRHMKEERGKAKFESTGDTIKR